MPAQLVHLTTSSSSPRVRTQLSPSLSPLPSNFHRIKPALIIPPMFKLELKLELPRFIAIRLRRRRRDIVKEECGHSNGTAVVGGPGHLTPTLDSRSLPISTIDSASANRESDLAVYTSTPQPPTTQSSSDSFGRQGFDAANLALPVISTIAGAIPILGSPIQAAINGLLQILNVVDVSGISVPRFLETKSTQIFSRSGRTKKKTSRS